MFRKFEISNRLPYIFQKLSLGVPEARYIEIPLYVAVQKLGYK